MQISLIKCLLFEKCLLHKPVLIAKIWHRKFLSWIVKEIQTNFHKAKEYELILCLDNWKGFSSFIENVRALIPYVLDVFSITPFN